MTDELPDELTLELDDELPVAGLLYEGDDELLPAAALALLVLLPTLMPPLLVPVLGLAVLEGLPAELFPEVNP